MQDTSDVCPNCGRFDNLVASVGWCAKCVEEAGLNPCETCGNPTDDAHKNCRKCRHIQFLERNADEIDRIIGHGATVAQAVDALKRYNRTKLKCLRCGGSMKPATNGISVFCTKYKKCRSAQNRLKYLVYRRLMKRDDALDQVLREMEETAAA